MVLLDVLAQDHRAFQSQQHHKHSNAPPPSRDGKNYSWKRHEDLCPGIGPNALAASDRRIYARLIAVGKGGAFQWPAASPEATASAGLLPVRQSSINLDQLAKEQERRQRNRLAAVRFEEAGSWRRRAGAVNYLHDRRAFLPSRPIGEASEDEPTAAATTMHRSQSAPKLVPTHPHNRPSTAPAQPASPSSLLTSRPNTAARSPPSNSSNQRPSTADLISWTRGPHTARLHWSREDPRPRTASKRPVSALHSPKGEERGASPNNAELIELPVLQSWANSRPQSAATQVTMTEQWASWGDAAFGW